MLKEVLVKVFKVLKCILFVILFYTCAIIYLKFILNVMNALGF